MLGPGKYDELCTYVREKSGADGALVIVLGGDQGPGFSAQGVPEVIAHIPQLLRFVADQIESDMMGPGQ